MTRQANTYCVREGGCPCEHEKHAVKTCMYMRAGHRPMVPTGAVEYRTTRPNDGIEPGEVWRQDRLANGLDEAALRRAEGASGMTREQAFAPNGILAGLPFVDMPQEPVNDPEHAAALKREATEGVFAAMPSPVVPFPSLSPKFSPGQYVPDESRKKEFRKDVETAFNEVERLTNELVSANAALGKNPLVSEWRRIQSKAANDLSAAQYRLEQAFDRVPPRE